MTFSAEEQFALQLDSEDPLRHFRQTFHLPLGKHDRPLIYFAGNSLGLMPKAARAIVEEELDNWANLGVDAHHATGTPWYSYHEALRDPTARLLGAKPLEVICMNSLTVNLHLMMATFYRPTKSRFRTLMEEPAFPSDTYAIKTQIVHHGLDPKDALLLARPRKGEFTVRTEAIVDLIEKNADTLAVVMIGAVNFFTGQLFDIPAITAAAQKHGIRVGVDLAHAGAARTTNRFGVITPRESEARGCQLSIVAHENPKELHKKLESAGVKADFREPNVIRAAPAPLYSTFQDVWRFVQILSAR